MFELYRCLFFFSFFHSWLLCYSSKPCHSEIAFSESKTHKLAVEVFQSIRACGSVHSGPCLVIKTQIMQPCATLLYRLICLIQVKIWRKWLYHCLVYRVFSWLCPRSQSSKWRSTPQTTTRSSAWTSRRPSSASSSRSPWWWSCLTLTSCLATRR